MAFCSKCGLEIQSGVAFCPNCGNAVANSNIGGNNTTPKKSKNKLVGLIACALALIVVIVGVVSIISMATAGNYEKVAVKYAESYFRADYDGIKDSLPYDVDEMFYDMFRAMCREQDMSLEEGYEEFEEEFEISINGADDLLPKYCDGYARMISDENEEYSIEVEVSDTRELEDYEIEAAIDENNYYYSEWGVDLGDYVDEDKIKKGYEVQLSVTFDNGEYVDTEEITYTVVKYGGKWKVLTIFNPDMY